MTDQSLIKRTLIELDCLFDTRLACISLISAACAAEIMTKGYFERQSDEFWKKVSIDKEEYLNLYKNRGDNPRVLEASHITMFMAYAFPSMIRALINEVLFTPFSVQFEIVINEYPYSLSNKEREILSETIKDFVAIDFNVSFVRKSPKQLTPAYISSTFAMLTMYDYETFVKEQGDALIKNPLTDVKFYSPAIYGVRVPTLEEMQEMHNNQIDPFSEVRLIASPMMDLELLPISNFSVVDINAHRTKEEHTKFDEMLKLME